MFTEKYPQILEEYKKIMLNDTPVVVSFSGGKDSSLILNIFFEALYTFNKDKKFVILFSDTEIEMLPYQIYVDNTIKKIERFIDKLKLNGEILKVTPDIKNNYYSLLIGKGYMPPKRMNRWCSDRLKIQPQQKAVNHLLKEYGTYINIIGTRKDESTSRKDSIERNSLEGFFLKSNNKNIQLFAPIQELTLKEVWEGLYFFKDAQSWFSFNELYKLYRLADPDKNKIPDARFGCMFCTVINKDTTLEELKKYYPYLKDISDFREYINNLKTGNFEKRDFLNHRNFTLSVNEDKIIPGGFSLRTRKGLLEKILQIESKHNITLIKQDVLNYIQERWFLEGDFFLSARKIAEQYGRKIEIPFFVKFITSVIKEISNEEKTEHFYREHIQELYSILKKHCKDINDEEEVYGKKDDILKEYVEAGEKNLANAKLKIDEYIDSYIRESMNNEELPYWTFEKKLLNGEIKIETDIFGEPTDKRYERLYKAYKFLQDGGLVEENPYLTYKEKEVYFEKFDEMEIEEKDYVEMLQSFSKQRKKLK